MSSDKHTTLAGFVANKNVIKPYTPVLLFPPLSQPFNSPSLHGVSQIYWTGGRQGTRWRRARTKCSYSSLPTALSTLRRIVCLCGHRTSRSSGQLSYFLLSRSQSRSGLRRFSDPPKKVWIVPPIILRRILYVAALIYFSPIILPFDALQSELQAAF